MQATTSPPLTMNANTFSAGRTYTFRLSASPLQYSNLLSHTDVVLEVNSPPRVRVRVKGRIRSRVRVRVTVRVSLTMSILIIIIIIVIIFIIII
jgi:hypothetical protein